MKNTQSHNSLTYLYYYPITKYIDSFIVFTSYTIYFFSATSFLAYIALIQDLTYPNIHLSFLECILLPSIFMLLASLILKYYEILKSER